MRHVLCSIPSVAVLLILASGCASEHLQEKPKPQVAQSPEERQPQLLGQPSFEEERNLRQEGIGEAEAQLAVMAPGSTAPRFWVRIAFWNDSKEKPLSRNCRMWIRGLGDFYPASQQNWQYGGTLIERAGPFAINSAHTIYFYPDYSDPRREITVPFRYSAEMNPEGSPRDMLMIEIKRDTITFSGIPISNANGVTELVFDRETCEAVTSPTNRISGMAVEQGSLADEVIGSWFYQLRGAGDFDLSCTFTIYRQDGHLYIKTTYTDGSGGIEPITERRHAEGRFFQTEKQAAGRAGEYFLLNDQGNLQYCDEEGCFAIAKRIQ